MSQEILLYATTWCYSCRRARDLFDRMQIPYQFINIDQSQEARAYVEKVNNGFRSVPTIVFPDGSILVEPRDVELTERLKQFQAAQ